MPDFMLEAAAQLDPPAGRCRWDRPRLVARVRRQRVPVTRETRHLLGPMCPGCAAALLPKPKPRPQARARSSTAGYRRVLLAAGRPAAALDPAAGITAQQAQYNRAAMVRLGMDPAKAPHLTRPTVGAR